MLTLQCKTQDTVLLKDLVPFQGKLKKRKQQDIDLLIESIKNDGLLMPFAVWKSPEGKLLLLDGHGRLEAISQMAIHDLEILDQELPVLYIEAENEETARKSLLQITSTYGKVDKKGVLDFAVTLADYKAPVLLKAQPKLLKKRTVKREGFSRLVIQVPTYKEQDLRKILQSTPYIEIIG